MKTYRFDFYKSVPVQGGGWKGTRGIKTIKGHDAVNAARRLYKALARQWANPIKLEIDGGILLGNEGFIPLNPDVLPILNANLYMEYQIAQKANPS